MFVPDRLKTNAFRILRLSADATPSEIHKAAGTIRRTASLGVAVSSEADIRLLGVIPHTEANIRAAIGRLENPVQRLSDRLFWFHLPSESRDVKAPALRSESDGPEWDHDDALRNIFATLEAGFDNVGVPLWIRALRAWNQVVSNDDYWAHTAELEQRGAFEPAALPCEIDALRQEAVGLAAEPLVVAGRDALARDDVSTVRRILAAMEELADTGPWAAVAQDDIASPAVERFRALCRAVQEELGSKIVREQNSGDRNKSVCDAEFVLSRRPSIGSLPALSMRNLQEAHRRFCAGRNSVERNCPESSTDVLRRQVRRRASQRWPVSTMRWAVNGRREWTQRTVP